MAAADNQVMVIPVEKDSDGRTVAEVMMSAGKDGIEVSFQEKMLSYWYGVLWQVCVELSESFSF